MVYSTTPTIEGHPILEYKGVVTGETIIGALKGIGTIVAVAILIVIGIVLIKL